MIQMTELSKTILEKYQIRKTKKQKSQFISLMQAHFPEMTIQQKGNVRNLVFGDVEKASMVLGAHYDTCARLPFPNFIMPKSPVLSILYGLVALIPVFLVVALINLGLFFCDVDFDTRWLISVSTVCAAMVLMIVGPANKHTVNDNTSGVITLCELMVHLSASEKRKVAFVLFDREETGMQGSSLFRKRYKKSMADKLLVNFDCVSDGDHIMVAASKAARKKYTKQLDQAFQPTDTKAIVQINAERVYFPSDQHNFNCSVVIGALHKKPFIGYYLNKIHTKRDTVMDKTNIKLLCDSILRLIRIM